MIFWYFSVNSFINDLVLWKFATGTKIDLNSGTEAPRYPTESTGQMSEHFQGTFDRKFSTLLQRMPVCVGGVHAKHPFAGRSRSLPVNHSGRARESSPLPACLPRSFADQPAMWAISKYTPIFRRTILTAWKSPLRPFFSTGLLLGPCLGASWENLHLSPRLHCPVRAK